MPSDTTPATNTVKALTANRAEWERSFFEAIATAVEGDDQLMHRAGGHGNHTLWIIGHLAATDDFFYTALSGQPSILPEGFNDTFGGGTQPTDHRGDYPSRDELLDLMRKTRARLMDWWSGLSDEELDKPLAEELRPFAPDVRSVPISCAMHEMYHLGQIASCRSSLGLKPVFF